MKSIFTALFFWCSVALYPLERLLSFAKACPPHVAMPSSAHLARSSHFCRLNWPRIERIVIKISAHGSQGATPLGQLAVSTFCERPPTRFFKPRWHQTAFGSVPDSFTAELFWILSGKLAQRSLFGRSACTATEPLSDLSLSLIPTLKRLQSVASSVSRYEPLALLRSRSLLVSCAIWKNGLHPGLRYSYRRSNITMHCQTDKNRGTDTLTQTQRITKSVRLLYNHAQQATSTTQQMIFSWKIHNIQCLIIMPGNKPQNP